MCLFTPLLSVLLCELAFISFRLNSGLVMS